MIIERVELENFVSHRRTVLTFPLGVTVIVGPNGAGKTSIVDAITYSLFGVHGRGQAQARDPIIRLGATVARVRTEFSVGGRRYAVVKVVPRTGPGETKLYDVTDSSRPVLLAEGLAKVKSELSRILGIQLDVLKHLMVARQGEIDAIVRSGEERKRVVNAVLQLDAVEKAYERMGELVSRWRERLAYLSSQLKQVERRLAELRAKRRRLEELSRQLREAEEELARKRAKLRELEEAVKPAEELRAKAESLRAELRAVEARLGELEESRESVKRRVEQLRARLEELEGVVALAGAKDVIAEYAALLEERSRLLSEVERLRSRLEALKASGLSIDVEQLETAVRDYERLSARLRALEEKKRLYEAYTARAQELRKQVDELARDLERARRRVYARIASKLADLVAEEQIASKTPEELVRALRSLGRRVDELIRERQERAKEIKQRMGGLQGLMEDIARKIAFLGRAYGNRCPLCGQPLDVGKREQLIKKLKQERDRLRQEERELADKLAQVESELRALEEVRSAISEAIADAQALLDYARQVEGKRARLEEEAREAEERARELWLAVKEYEELSERLRSLARVAEEYGRAISALREALAARHRLEELERDLGELENRITEVRSRLGELAAHLPQDPSELRKLVLEVERAIAEKRLVEEELGRLKQEEEALGREIEALRARREELVSKLARLEGELARFEQLRGELERLSEEVKELERRISYLRGQVDSLAEDVSQLPTLEREYEQLSRRRRAVQQMVSVLTRIRSELGPQGLQRLVRVRARELLEAYLRDILQRFGLEADDVRLTDDYDVVLVTRWGEKRLSMLSGGERVAVAIAFRIALAKLAGARLGVMILDEPTTNLDEERRRELVEVIKYGLRETGLSQLIVVSHDRELEEAADTVIEVVRDRTGASAVRVLEPRHEVAPALQTREPSDVDVHRPQP